MPDFSSREAWDRGIIEGADYFTVVSFLGVGQYERHERKKLEKATALAHKLEKENKRHYIIYAVKGIHSVYVTSTKEAKRG